VMPHYLESTNTPAGPSVLSVMVADLPKWFAVCADALAYMAADARFDAKRLGVLGFSLGGHLALEVAMTPPTSASVKAVVDFFGPTTSVALPNRWGQLPPVLIIHGADDSLVFISDSEYAVAQLKAAGKIEGRDYVFKPVKGQGHGFKGLALTESRDDAVAFFKKQL